MEIVFLYCNGIKVKRKLLEAFYEYFFYNLCEALVIFVVKQLTISKNAVEQDNILIINPSQMHTKQGLKFQDIIKKVSWQNIYSNIDLFI